jgi:hypothetical protein
VQRQGLKEIIDSIQLENSELVMQLKTLQDTVASLSATSKTEDLALRDKLGSLRAQLADEDAKQRLEMKEIKSKYNSKMQVGHSDRGIERHF